MQTQFQHKYSSNVQTQKAKSNFLLIDKYQLFTSGCNSKLTSSCAQDVHMRVKLTAQPIVFNK